ncbi:MAG: Rieske (2Fe-2S) protein, partial [Burkholderiales bacterium]
MALRYDTVTTPPPSFAQGRNMRQKVRATGLDPNYWYAVEFADRIQPAQVLEVVFWKRSIALFRDSNGELHAIENRCAHRQLKLTLGSV